jgi:hypothetical protein
MSIPWKHSGLFVLLAACTIASACVTWHVQADVPTARPAFDSTKTYRVTLRNGERRLADHPRILGDTLIWVEPVANTPRATQVAPIPLAEIRLVETEGTNWLGTIVLGWLAAAALIAVISPPSFPY